MSETLIRLVGLFVFTYPLIMAVAWSVAGFRFWWSRERGNPHPPDCRWPPVTILVPCHNEENAIAATCEGLRRLDYPDYRVMFVDDASKDRTGEILRYYTARVPIFHVLTLTQNRGKAAALNDALESVVATPIVIVIDADTHLCRDALRWMVAPFLTQPRIGAVTGNPIVRNRASILERFQAAEFATIVGLIRRSQRGLGRVALVSGCATAYRTGTLRSIGGFSPDTATEDIDVAWKIQRDFHEVWFAPGAVAFIEVPSTLTGLWNQRKRWSLGGWHLIRAHWDVFTRWRWRRLWPLMVDFQLACLWALCFVLGSLLWLLSTVVDVPTPLSPIPAWHGAVLSVVCIVQAATALVVNHKYDRRLWRCFFWVPWYPLAYFVLGAVAAVWTLPRGLFGRRDSAVGRWQSPPRSSSPAGDVDEISEGRAAAGSL